MKDVLYYSHYLNNINNTKAFYISSFLKKVTVITHLLQQ